MSGNLWSVIGDKGRGGLVTLKRDGRPQVSTVDFLADLMRDSRASLYVTKPDGWAYAVAEGEVALAPVAADPTDATVEELIEVYRGIAGEHPDWDDYRRAMVADGRLVIRLNVNHLYGWAN